MKLPIMQFPVTSSLLDPKTFLSTLFLYTLSLCFSLSLEEQVSHPYKRTGEIIVIYKYISSLYIQITFRKTKDPLYTTLKTFECKMYHVLFSLYSESCTLLFAKSHSIFAQEPFSFPTWNVCYISPILTKFGTCRHVLLKLVTVTLGHDLFTFSRNVSCVPTNGRTDIRLSNYTFSTIAVAPTMMYVYLYIIVLCRMFCYVWLWVVFSVLITQLTDCCCSSTHVVVRWF
jgi:hypothetical protein